MITNDGKELIAKYLLGQAPEYATYVSIGCGATPLDLNDSYPSASILQQKSIMDFEMTRVPIVSKGFVDENGTTKITFSAELPKENRYDITEVGLWSAAGNNLAPNSDSRVIFNFSESWESHDVSISSLPFFENIASGVNIGDISEELGSKIFSVSSNNITLRNAQRAERKEGPRYLNNKILMRGDTSSINSGEVEITSATANGTSITYTANNTFSSGDVVTIVGCSNENFNFFDAIIDSRTSSSFTVLSKETGSSTGGIAWETGSWQAPDSTHIHLQGINLSIASNSPNDLLKLAFSLVDRTASGAEGVPESVKILIEFYRNEVATSRGFAKAEIYLDGSSFSNNRYKIVEIPISNLITSPDFTASEIRVCRIFVSIEDNSQPSDQFYVALDGFRLDNVSTINPLYKMIGYSIVKKDGNPIVKYQNTNNYVEFRLDLGLS